MHRIDDSPYHIYLQIKKTIPLLSSTGLNLPFPCQCTRIRTCSASFLHLTSALFSRFCCRSGYLARLVCLSVCLPRSAAFSSVIIFIGLRCYCWWWWWWCCCSDPSIFRLVIERPCERHVAVVRDGGAMIPSCRLSYDTHGFGHLDSKVNCKGGDEERSGQGTTFSSNDQLVSLGYRSTDMSFCMASPPKNLKTVAIWPNDLGHRHFFILIFDLF